MDSITFKNFRQFKDKTTFELNNINILVGKNNSGKSTLTKGLRLYLYNIKNLKVDSFNNIFCYKPFFLFGGAASDNPHIGTFGRALSKGSEDDFIMFSARFGHIAIETVVSRYYKDANGTKIDCFDKTTAPISCITISDDNMESHYLFDFETGTQTIVIDAKESSTCYKEWRKEIEKIKRNQELYRKHKSGREFYSYDEDKERVMRLERCSTFKFKELIQLEIPLQPTQFDGPLYSTLFSSAIQNYLDLDVWTDGMKEKNPLLYELKNDESDDCFNFLFEIIKNQTGDDVGRIIEHVQMEYIEAHSVTHSIVYNGSDKNDYMAQTILHYLNENIGENDPEKEFVEDWMMKFDIGEDFEIESIGGECYKLGIIEDVDHPENITPLLDKGVGSNQIMILLLQLATIMHKNRGASVPPMVIIEEPEQNLHPKLQSCLADLFREVYLYPLKQNKNSRGISFIIETHSEYLVRKSQVLVAKREQTDANPFTVFYMEKGKEPREIRYQDSGVFYDDFGEGFYDETISLTEEIV